MKLVVVTGVTLMFLATIGYAAEPYGKHLCKQAGYSCKKVKRGQTWESLFPNKQERRMVMSLNRTNMPLYYRSFIVVPDDLSSLSLMDLSPFPLNISVPGERLVLVDLNELAFAAYSKDGKLVHWGPVAGGMDYCPDVNRACNTAKGEFRVYSKRGKYCVSNTYPVDVIEGGAPMPYCMFFNGGFAMHASTTVPGYNASHGCVRMSYEDAKWLSDHFVTTANGGTKVIVK
jgi:L,D-transpeptidase ErfK/SrfK